MYPQPCSPYTKPPCGVVYCYSPPSCYPSLPSLPSLPSSHSSSPSSSSSWVGYSAADCRAVSCSSSIRPRSSCLTKSYQPLIRTVPLPSVGVRVYEEYILAHTKYESKKKIPFYFDLRYHIDLIRLGGTGSSSCRSLSKDILRRPASVPKSQGITIKSPDLPWSLHLKSCDAYLTIEEVLIGLYKYLRTPLNRGEWDFIRKQHPLVAQRCEKSFANRCMISDRRKHEESAGYRRVDLLQWPLFGGFECMPDGTLWMKTLPA